MRSLDFTFLGLLQLRDLGQALSVVGFGFHGGVRMKIPALCTLPLLLRLN